MVACDDLYAVRVVVTGRSGKSNTTVVEEKRRGMKGRSRIRIKKGPPYT
jgi:hypothetical protein